MLAWDPFCMLGDLFLKGFKIMVLGNRMTLKVTYKTSPCIRWTQEFVYVKGFG